MFALFSVHEDKFEPEQELNLFISRLSILILHKYVASVALSENRHNSDGSSILGTILFIARIDISIDTTIESFRDFLSQAAQRFIEQIFLFLQNWSQDGAKNFFVCLAE